MQVRQDTLRVQVYKDRAVVDLDPNDRSEDFVAIDPSGVSIHLGAEKALLSWDAVDQLIDSLATGRAVFRPPVKVTEVSLFRESAYDRKERERRQ